MTKLIALIVVIAVFQGSLAKPRPEDLDISKAKDAIKDVQNALNLDPENVQKVTDTINANTQTLADNLKEFLKKIKDESNAHEGEVDNVLKSVQEKLSETAASLEKAFDPKTLEEANKLKAGFEDGIKKTVEEAEKLHKNYKPQIDEAKTKVDQLTQSLLDQIVAVGKNVRASIDKTIAEHEKTHSH